MTLEILLENMEDEMEVKGLDGYIVIHITPKGHEVPFMIGINKALCTYIDEDRIRIEQ